MSAIRQATPGVSNAEWQARCDLAALSTDGNAMRIGSAWFSC